MKNENCECIGCQDFMNQVDGVHYDQNGKPYCKCKDPNRQPTWMDALDPNNPENQEGDPPE
jgi:hypothetical protein